MRQKTPDQKKRQKNPCERFSQSSRRWRLRRRLRPTSAWASAWRGSSRGTSQARTRRAGEPHCERWRQFQTISNKALANINLDNLIMITIMPPYRVGMVLSYLGWVDIGLGVPPSCPTYQPVPPNFNLLKRNLAGGGISKIKVNPTQVTDPVCIANLVRFSEHS